MIRLDGPNGPDSPPLDWGTVPMLDQAIRQVAGQVAVPVPSAALVDEDTAEPRPLVPRRGAQLDVEPVHVSTELDGVSDKQVAAYIAKYATRGAESARTADRPIRQVWEIAHLDVTEHARRMIYACFNLGDPPEYRDVLLRRWAHALGYGGHFSAKSRHYCTPLEALRNARLTYQAEQARQALGLPDPGERQVVTIAE